MLQDNKVQLGQKVTFPLKVTAVSKYGYPSITGYFQRVSQDETVITITDYPRGMFGESHLVVAEAWDFYLAAE